MASQATYFEFIGPDRDVFEFTDISNFIKVAKATKISGLPNYKGVCIPLKSNINIPAWYTYPLDYLDKRLLQYLKVGCPLFLCCYMGLCNHVLNHFFASQHPQAIEEYLSKEMHLGAILGHFENIPFSQFHYSPLLTLPKDGGRCSVILDLSYHKGFQLMISWIGPTLVGQNLPSNFCQLTTSLQRSTMLKVK